MAEITVTLTLEEAESLCPWNAADKAPDAWNRRMSAAEDAVQKLRAALREARAERSKEQGSLL